MEPNGNFLQHEFRDRLETKLRAQHKFVVNNSQTSDWDIALPDYVGLSFRVKGGWYRKIRFGYLNILASLGITDDFLREHTTKIKDFIASLRRETITALEGFDFIAFDSPEIYKAGLYIKSLERYWEYPIDPAFHAFNNFYRDETLHGKKILIVNVDEFQERGSKRDEDLQDVSKTAEEVSLEDRLNIFSFGKILIEKGEIIIYKAARESPQGLFEDGELLDYDDVEFILKNPDNDYSPYYGWINEGTIKRIPEQDVVYFLRRGEKRRAEPETHKKILGQGFASGTGVAYLIACVDRTGMGGVPEPVPIAVFPDKTAPDKLNSIFYLVSYSQHTAQ